VLGHVLQQRAILVRVARGMVVALHDDRAADAFAATHRHAEPVGAVGSVRDVALHAELTTDARGWTKQRLAVPQQGHGEAVGHAVDRDLDIGLGHVGIALVGEVEEAHGLGDIVVQHDVEVRRRHQAADDAVDTTQHLRHLQPGACEFGDLIERLLQAF